MLFDRVTKDKLYPALVLERWFPAYYREQALYLLGAVILIGFGLGIFLSQPRGSGVALVACGLFSIIQSLDWFYRNFYFKRLALKSGELDPLAGLLVLTARREGDYLAALATIPFGQRLLARLDLADGKFTALLLPEREKIADLLVPLDAVVDLPHLAQLIFDASGPLKKLCAEEGITAADFNTVSLVVAWEIDNDDVRRRWWSRTAFDELPTVGADWAYGQLYWLKRYTTAADNYAVPFELDQSALTRLTDVLARSRGANALLVGPAGDEGLALVARLARAARARAAPPAIRGRRFLVLSVGHFLAQFANGHELEMALLALLNEAVRAGNVVLVIDDLAVFLARTKSLAVDLPSLLEPYLAHPTFQIVALAENQNFQNQIEPIATLMDRFELVRFGQGQSGDNLLTTLRAVRAAEAEYNLLFTYRAVKELARAASGYFAAEGTPAAELADLLVEIGPWLLAKKINLVSRENVLDFLREKTQIPQGAVTKEEKEQLLNLEPILHQRIIGQDEAIKAVAEAVRRARTDLRREDKPIASFLFLGPTGVGKTETAKSLAATLFGGEERLLRLDMSEYQGEDALERLIGSATTLRAGNLSALVRSHPYGVILFDEFEKCHQDVRNLFLQILDEGFFSDMLGKKVFLREHLIIATSNAGADLIWDLVKANKNLTEATGTLIDHLVHTGIFTPELLNRFDATVIFKPLSDEELAKVAAKMLGSLVEKLAGEGVKLTVTPALATAVAAGGANKVFGARPMQRFIQDKLEDQIAKGLLTGAVSRGQEISFDPATLKLNEGK